MTLGWNTTIKRMVFPHFRWLKPLVVSNGGYINTNYFVNGGWNLRDWWTFSMSNILHPRSCFFSQDSWRNPLEKCWGPGRIRSDPFPEPIWVGVGNFSTSKVSWLMIVTAVRLQSRLLRWHRVSSRPTGRAPWKKNACGGRHGRTALRQGWQETHF